MKLNEIYFALLNVIMKGASEKEINCRLHDFIYAMETFSANETKVLSTYRVLHQIRIDANIKKKNVDTALHGLLDRVIGLIDIEINITQLKLTNLELIKIDKGHDKEMPELLNWTDDKIHLVALIYAISKSINNGNAKIKQIVRCFEFFFQIKLGNVYDILQDLNIRKKGPCSYLERLPEILEKKIDELNSKK